METIIFHPETDKNAIAEAAAILRRGGLLGERKPDNPP